MKRNYYLIVLFLLSFAGYGQTYNKDAREYFKNGNDKISGKNYPGAIEDFTKAINSDPGFKQAYENRGVARFYLQDYTGAIEDYSKAIKMDPNEYTTYGRRGWAKFYIHDFKGAIGDLDKAVEGSSDKYRYYNFRGEAKFKLKDYEGAISDFTKVIKSWSAGKEQKNKALYWRGTIRIITGDKESGCNDLRKAYRSGFPEAEMAIEQYCNK
jgi:tetratricopeptide (TPR) repeat protein